MVYYIHGLRHYHKHVKTLFKQIPYSAQTISCDNQHVKIFTLHSSSRLHCIFFVAVSHLNPFQVLCCFAALHDILRNSFVPKFVPRSLLCLDLSCRVLGSFPALSLDFFCFLSSAFSLFCFSFFIKR